MNPQLGGPWLERAFEVAQQLRAMTPDARSQWMREGRAALEREYPGEALDEAAKDIQAMFALAGEKHPMVEALKRGQLNDPWLFKSLAAQAGHLQRWSASRPGDKK
jgi:hypothetical protein